MKGVIFIELLEMVDEAYGPNMTEAIIEKANLPSGGAYTSIGTYEHTEAVALVTARSRSTSTCPKLLLKAFGNRVMSRFELEHNQMFSCVKDLFGFLERVDGYIHTDVRRLYPDATLPKIRARRHGEDQLELTYRSCGQMGDLAEGLLEGAIHHYCDNHTLQRTDNRNEGDEQCVTFMLSRTAN